jgi:transcription-repair coupling factor (superfamily II helicase)
MRDLDIRGAGTMLGAVQSGFIEDVGFETYHAILDEAVRELRREEFADVFADHDDVPPAAEATIDVDDDVFIPADYVANAVERLNLYRRLATITSAEDLSVFRQELADRFGPLPPAVETLLAMAGMKPAAQALRLTRAAWKNQRLFLTFPDKEADAHFYDSVFEPLLGRLEASGQRWVLKEKEGRLRAIVQDVDSLARAADLLERLANPEAVHA